MDTRDLLLQFAHQACETVFGCDDMVIQRALIAFDIVYGEFVEPDGNENEI